MKNIIFDFDSTLIKKRVFRTNLRTNIAKISSKIKRDRVYN